MEIKKRSSQIKSFSIESIITFDLDTAVKSINQSKLFFFSMHENNFLILPDSNTIVGAFGFNSNNLVSEDIITNKATWIATFSRRIYTVLYDPKTRSLFAGDHNGHLRQFQRSTDSFTLTKNYGNLRISHLVSSTLAGDLAIFGGYNFWFRAVKVSS